MRFQSDRCDPRHSCPRARDRDTQAPENCRISPSKELCFKRAHGLSHRAARSFRLYVSPGALPKRWPRGRPDRGSCSLAHRGSNCSRRRSRLSAHSCFALLIAPIESAPKLPWQHCVLSSHLLRRSAADQRNAYSPNLVGFIYAPSSPATALRFPAHRWN